MEEDFQAAKGLLCHELTIKPFDKDLQTEMLTDASRLKGLGFMLIQREEDRRPRIIQCGSFSLTASQRNYAVIKLECLAMVEAIIKCDFYLRGCLEFTVV